jgi:hypothetical protein
MTQQRRDDKSTEFGIWLRQQKQIDSSLGFIASNLDYIWSNYKTGQWMLIEEKRYGSVVKRYQSELFCKVHMACKGASGYCGFHVIIFENTSPDDGKIFLDETEIDKKQLFDFLKFIPIDGADRIDTNT